MATKSGQKGRYICKVGHLDVYAKDTYKPKKDSKYKYLKPNVASTVYNLYHSKKLVEKGLKTKDEAITKALEVLGEKYRAIYNL
jgi:hypothetical protein